MYRNNFSDKPTSDLAIDGNGNILVLSCCQAGEPAYSITRCSAKGEPLSHISLSNLPPEFSSGFFPTALACSKNQIYLVDKEETKAVVTDAQGAFMAGYYITADCDAGQDAAIKSFSVDNEGNLVITLYSQADPIVIPHNGRENGEEGFHVRRNKYALNYSIICFIGMFISFIR